jgi:hypothetical protein
LSVGVKRERSLAPTARQLAAETVAVVATKTSSTIRARERPSPPEWTSRLAVAAAAVVDAVIASVIAKRQLEIEHERRAAWRRTEESAARFVADHGEST